MAARAAPRHAEGGEEGPVRIGFLDLLYGGGEAFFPAGRKIDILMGEDHDRRLGGIEAAVAGVRGRGGAALHM